MKRPRFWIALSTIIMVPNFLISFVIFIIKFQHEYLHWVNGDMSWIVDSMYYFMIFCFIVFCVGAILLLITLYILDKEREKEQKKLDE